MADPTKTLLGYEDGKRAQQMRKEGYSYRQIGKILGVNHSTVSNTIKRTLAEDTKRIYSSNNRETDLGRNGNPIIISGQHRSLTAAVFGDPTPERRAFIQQLQGQSG